MSDYKWPNPATRPLLGKRISRVDGPVKVSGRAKYTFDYNPEGLLAGKILRCPHAHARITSIDTSAAEKIRGVKAIQIIQKPGTEIFWAGDEVVGVAAVDECTAEDALRAIKVQYEVLPHFVSDAEPPKDIAVNNGPISQDDFEDMEDNQVPDEQVVAAIRHQGISFHPDAKYLKDLQESGADPSVVQALRTAKYLPSKGARSPYKQTAVQNAGRARRSVLIRSGSSRRLVRRLGHHPLLSRISWHGGRVARPTKSCSSISRRRTCRESRRRLLSLSEFPQETSR